MSSDGYSVQSYSGMAGDKVRVSAYAEALRRAITPGCTVLDIGTGTGIFALIACQLGAGRVYAIEPHDAIHVARQMAAANGFADRIQFFHDYSTRVTLPEQVDVMVSDMRGMLPLFDHHLPAIIDARQRFLKPGGVQIPLRDVLYISPVSAEAFYQRFTSPWSAVDFNFNMDAARRVLVNSWGKGRIDPDEIALPAQHWVTLDYTTLETLNAANTLRWANDTQKDLTLHGFLVWFEATPLEGIHYTTAPDQPELAYSTSFFPLSESVQLKAGDVFELSLRADLVGDDYVWTWNSSTYDAANGRVPIKNLRQSTFWGSTMAAENLRKRSDNFVPSLGDDGQVDMLILQAMNGEQSSGDIARQLAAQFPQRFANWQAALEQVAKLAVKYSR